jgi:hypothetical protein
LSLSSSAWRAEMMMLPVLGCNCFNFWISLSPLPSGRPMSMRQQS